MKKREDGDEEERKNGVRNRPLIGAAKRKKKGEGGWLLEEAAQWSSENEEEGRTREAIAREKGGSVFVFASRPLFRNFLPNGITQRGHHPFLRSAAINKACHKHRQVLCTES